MPGEASEVCEGFAISQSIKEAIQELSILDKRLATQLVDTARAPPRMKVQVIIFSDSRTILQRMKTGQFPGRSKHIGHAIIVYSERLREEFRKPGSRLRVNLVVQWIPGHCDSDFPLHSIADKLSRKCREVGRPLLRTGELSYVECEGLGAVHEEVKAAKRYKEERLSRWREREEMALDWQDEEIMEETQAGEDLQAQQAVQNTQQPASAATDQSYQQEWQQQVQTFYQQSAAYWEEVSRWQDSQRAHGHPTGQWYWDANSNQWVWQWDNQRLEDTSESQSPS